MTDRSNPIDRGFECVDPEWGDQLWRTHLPDLDPETRRGLDDHLFICDACQLTMAAERAAATALQSGRVQVAPPQPHQRPGLVALRWSSGLAMAAALVLMFMLPPDGRQVGGVRRGDDATPQFVRPVEGEVLLTEAPELRWTAIPGATSYQVQISEVGGPYQWSGLTDDPAVRVPAEHPLPADGIFRGLVHPVPTDLAGLADVSVAFSRSGWREFLTYRAGASPLWLRFLGLAGLVGFMGGLLWPRRRQVAIS